MADSKVKLSVLSGGRLRPLLVGAFLLGVSVTAYALLTTEVPPNSLAVRQVFLGPSKGIQPDVLGPGLHVVIPGYEQLHVFPRDLQLLELNDGDIQASVGAFSAPSIRIQTSEGYQVTVDITVAYRIIDPYKLITTVGPGRLYETALVGPRSDTYLRQALGKLNAEQFYDGAARRAAAQDARRHLEVDLINNGIAVWGVMVRHYTYDDRYQEAIEQRKIQDQTVFANQAEALAAAQEAEKNRVLAEGEARVKVEGERGRAEVRRIGSTADLEYRTKVADGDLLAALAEAEGTRLENAALQVVGAANIVGIEMAEALRGTQVIIVPTDGASAMNPLNLDSMLEGW